MIKITESDINKIVKGALNILKEGQNNYNNDTNKLSAALGNINLAALEREIYPTHTAGRAKLDMYKKVDPKGAKWSEDYINKNRKRLGHLSDEEKYEYGRAAYKLSKAKAFPHLFDESIDPVEADRQKVVGKINMLLKQIDSLLTQYGNKYGNEYIEDDDYLSNIQSMVSNILTGC